jgi:hypothetical protein
MVRRRSYLLLAPSGESAMIEELANPGALLEFTYVVPE